MNTAFWLPLIVWLLRNFFAEVPVSLERAARIDGCSRLGTLFRVTIPAARPGIAAAAILILIGTWNEFLFAVILGNHNAVTITRLITAITNFPYRLERIAAAGPAGRRRARRRDPVPDPRPAVPPPDHHRPHRGPRQGLAPAPRLAATPIRCSSRLPAATRGCPLPGQPDVLGQAEATCAPGAIDEAGYQAVADEFVREILDEMAVVQLAIVGDGGVRARDRVLPWIRGLDGLAAGERRRRCPTASRRRGRVVDRRRSAGRAPLSVRDWTFADAATET